GKWLGQARQRRDLDLPLPHRPARGRSRGSDEDFRRNSRSCPARLRAKGLMMLDPGAFLGQVFVIVLLAVLAIFVVVVLFRSIRIILRANWGVVERLGK